ncbi:MAG: TIGR04013 family B12-binding domain/radical SAM domain-containing protein [Thermoprotei archaeon]|nr:MAG: TIGR04013 family B12-binding domain/radical SAM domain-containing protein [Thermoprotei archaeon]
MTLMEDMKRLRFLPSLKSKRSDVAIAFYYSNVNKYSINVLVAALDFRLGDVDIYLANGPIDSLLELVLSLKEKYRLIILCVSLLSTQLALILNELRDLLEKLRLLRRRGANIVTIAGGPHPTADPCGSLKLGFDYVVMGEGEETLPDLIRSLRDHEDVHEVKSIVIFEDGEYVYTGPRGKIILDEYPPFPFWRGLFNPIELMRGCSFTCTFCQTPFLHGASPRFRSLDCVKFYAEKFFHLGLRDLRFISPNALAYMSKCASKPNVLMLEEFLHTLRTLAGKYGGRIFYGSFPSEIRPEYISEETVDVLRKYTDNRSIVIGAQSGSMRVLKAIRRGHTVDDIVNSVKLALSKGFKVNVDFIFGFPFEEKEDFEESLKLAEYLTGLGARIHAHAFIPLPGTPLQNTTPKRIPVEVRLRLAKLIGEGKLFGQWEAQEKIALRIVELRRKNIFMTRCAMRSP